MNELEIIPIEYGKSVLSENYFSEGMNIELFDDEMQICAFAS